MVSAPSTISDVLVVCSLQMLVKPYLILFALDLILPQVTAKPILIYPNSGESYDADRKEWVVSSSVSSQFFCFLLEKDMVDWCWT